MSVLELEQVLGELSALEWEQVSDALSVLEWEQRWDLGLVTPSQLSPCLYSPARNHIRSHSHQRPTVAGLETVYPRRQHTAQRQGK